MSQELTPQHKQALTVLAREEEKRALTTRQVVSDMASSEFFRQNWDELLLAAPNCLELLGNINAIASTQLASTTPLKAPSGGFKHLQDYGNLKGGLAQLTNKGNVAFTTARIQMDKIHELAGSVPGQTRTIVEALGDPDVPMSVAMTSLEIMRDTAVECYKSAHLVEQDMIKWSDTCMELEEACTSESSSTESKAQKAALNLQLSQEEENFRKKQEEDTKKELEKMGTNLNDAKKNYQKALDDMPTGMDLVGQQVLMSLGEAASSAITIGATAAAAYINPIGGANAGVKALGDEARKFNSGNGAKGTSNNATSAVGIDGKTDKLPDAEAADRKRSDTLSKLTSTFLRRAKPKSESESIGAKSIETKTEAPPVGGSYGTYDLSGKFFPNDNALVIVPAIKSPMDELKAIVVGAPDGINWDAVLPPPDPAKGKVSECRRLSHALDRLIKDLKPTKNGLVSQLVTAIVSEAIGVSDDLELEAEKAKDLNAWKRPGLKSDFFKDLDERITRCSSTALALDTVAKSTPGGVGAGTASLLAPSQTPEEKIASTNAKASIAEQTIKSATTKLQSSQQVYTATLETYQKQSEQVLVVQDNLLRARQEVKTLTSEKLTLDIVKKVLVQCISYLTDLKDRIGKLVIFFSSLTNLIDTCIKTQVEPFQKQLKNYASGNETKALLYGDFYRDLIYQFALRISANFSLYRDIAGMYMEVDRKCVQEGITLVSKLNITNTDAKITDEAYLKANKEKLNTFCVEAENTVKTVVKKKQAEIISGLQQRISDIGVSIKQFPVAFQPSQKTIEDINVGATITQTSTEMEAATPSNISTVIAGKPRKRVGY